MHKDKNHNVTRNTDEANHLKPKRKQRKSVQKMITASNLGPHQLLRSMASSTEVSNISTIDGCANNVTSGIPSEYLDYIIWHNWKLVTKAKAPKKIKIKHT